MHPEVGLSRLFTHMCGNVGNLMPINIHPRVVMPCLKCMPNAMIMDAKCHDTKMGFVKHARESDQG